jgi:hypothetical protein
MPMSNKDRKRSQRQAYHQMFNRLKIHHGHGGLSVRKKEQSALGSSGGSSTKGV